MYTKQIIHPQDIERVKYYLNLESMQQKFYANQRALGFRLRVLWENEYHWVTVDILPGAECSPHDPWCVLSVREDPLAEQLVDELNRAYNHDIQTGLLNRNKYEKDLIELAKSDFASFVCVYIDAIGLHEVNNLNGHASGDAMLQAIAECASKQFSNEETNFVYRIGGDEFVILAANTELDEIQRKIDAMRKELDELGYAISVGIEATQDPHTLVKTLSTAERNMRTEKQEFYAAGGYDLQQRTLNLKLEDMIVKKRDAEHFLDLFIPDSTDIFIFNVDTEELRIVAISDHISEELEQTGGSFSKFLAYYCGGVVAPHYVKAFSELLDFDLVRTQLLASGRVDLYFERTDGTAFNLWVLPYSKDFNESGLTMWVFSEAKSGAGIALPEK